MDVYVISCKACLFVSSLVLISIANASFHYRSFTVEVTELRCAYLTSKRCPKFARDCLVSTLRRPH